EYRGMFRDGKYNCRGVLISKDGERLEGDFVDNVFLENDDHKSSMPEAVITLTPDEEEQPLGDKGVELLDSLPSSSEPLGQPKSESKGAK
ncbi:MAG: hypothetical protein Q8J76_15160, partial [Desulfobulbaceae bacterium]|nr:hypothetical protein [Desulfobulbaceae bacterium]